MKCIYQDSGGYLWLGTDNGLCRFDGITFKNFKIEDGLRDNKIETISEDREGTIWIGSGGGLDCFTHGRIIPHTTGTSLNGCTVYKIVEDRDGKLWFGTSKGLGYFDGKTFRHFTTAHGLHSEKIYAVAVEKTGVLWLGTDSGLSRFEKGNFIRYSPPGGLPDNYVFALLYDPGSGLWIGTSKSLSCLNGGKHTFYTEEDGLIDDHVTTIMKDVDGNIWIGTWNGVSLFNGETFRNFSTKNGLVNNFVYSMSRDREGNIWFGTHGGTSCLTSINVKSYNAADGLGNEYVFDIIRDGNGGYWFGTSEGLSVLSNGRFINYTTKDGLIDNAVNTLMEDRKGRIWIGTPQGLSIFSSGSFSNYTRKDGLSSNILFELYESRDGTVWIGSRNNLNRCHNGQFSLPPFHAELENVLCIIEDSGGRLWFSSQETLYAYSQKGLSTFSSRDGLSGNIIRALYEDSKGKIWIGTEGGLNCFDGDAFTLYSNRNNTPGDDAYYFILEDTQGKLWFGNSKGLTCFDGKEFKTYTSERLGLTNRTWLSGITDDRGRLWLGSTEGVTCFLPPPVRMISTPPPVYITGVKSMEKEVPLAEEKSLFEYDQNIFRFNFVGISFTAPDAVGYKYLLEGIDKNWKFTDNHSLFYPFLPPGSYDLKVKAVNIDGVESETPANYRFKILPPFWRTWWFLGLTGLAVCVMVVLAIQLRIKRVREKAELAAKNRQLVMSQRMELMGTLAAGTVHDLKNLMAVIIGYSQVMGQKYRGDNEDNQNIEIIKETASTAMQMSKQILSFARPKDHPAYETVDLRWVLGEILDTLKITHFKVVQVQWEPPPEPVLFPIHPARFQQLVMNLCLNACQSMPTGGTLRIVLSRTAGKEITLEITDTGTGIMEQHLEKIFEPLFTTKEQGEGTGLGLFVVKQIVDEYNGKIEVQSIPAKGTTFVIRLPDN